MLSELARVFSSNGVLVQGSALSAASGDPSAADSCRHDGPDCGCFAPKFDQESAKVELSPQGMEMSARFGAQGVAPAEDGTEPGAKDPRHEEAFAGATALDEGERRQVEELRKRDREVKAHEAAHQAAAGGHAQGGAGYEYQTGPDGRRYAVGGHVDIDMSPVQGNPHATIRKARAIQAAAMAPADPSGQDRAVAAAAARMALQAQRELAQGKDGAGEAGRGGDAASESARGTAGRDSGSDPVPGAEGAEPDRGAAPDARILGYGRRLPAAAFSVYA